MDPKRVSTSDLKARCAQLIDEVRQGRTSLVVTRRGRPVARIVPIEQEPGSLFGFAKGSLTVCGDIVEPIDEPWEASP